MQREYNGDREAHRERGGGLKKQLLTYCLFLAIVFFTRTAFEIGETKENGKFHLNESYRAAVCNMTL